MFDEERRWSSRSMHIDEMYIFFGLRNILPFFFFGLDKGLHGRLIEKHNAPRSINLSCFSILLTFHYNPIENLKGRKLTLCDTFRRPRC